MNPKCKNCKSWSELPRRQADDHLPDEDGSLSAPINGQCRRRSPIVIDSCHRGKWPTTAANQWCLEWIPQDVVR